MTHIAITGASSGIGEAIAREFARHGAKVTLVARRLELLETLAAELQTETCVIAQDLSQPERVCDWIAVAEEALGPIDILVNNAGMQIISPSPEMDVERGELLLRLNVFAPLRLTRAVLPGMVARKRGTIVDIASMAALAPTAGMTYYNASKGALAGASEAMRGELRSNGVHVVTVYPGIIETDMGSKGLKAYKKSSLIALQPRGTTEGLARLIHKAVKRRRARVIYPRMYTLSRWFPGITRWFMDRFTPPLSGHGPK